MREKRERKSEKEREREKERKRERKRERGGARTCGHPNRTTYDLLRAHVRGESSERARERTRVRERDISLTQLHAHITSLTNSLSLHSGVLSRGVAHIMCACNCGHIRYGVATVSRID